MSDEEFPKDICMLLAYYQNGGDSFGCLVFRMISKADSSNYSRIKLAWPEYVRVWERWQAPDGQEWLAEQLMVVKSANAGIV